ncbi:MAG: hypothetical protein GXY34_02565 [Syntrophomonadaceae bacterium]|nr:hypothetical protein [Syntrophomonadaceae bacterium]
MRRIFGDLHIHIGSAGGRPVKITASRRMDLHTILFIDAPKKGLEMVGVVDAGSPLVLAEIEGMLNEGRLKELPGGGLQALNGVLLIPGCELETREGVHVIIYLPTLEGLKKYGQYMKKRIKNLTLSTQKAQASVADIMNLTVLLDGIFCPAHAFTPHKGIYGALTERLSILLGREAATIKALELGLSADTDMADRIGETRGFTFLSNSDAHSSPNIGREYNLFRMNDKSFTELRYALENRHERRVMANYGMDPRLGKYHRSYCNDCDLIVEDSPPVQACPACGGHHMVTGVLDRVMAIRDYDEPQHPIGRPPYHYRVPLKELPGLGPKNLNKLIAVFGDEIKIAEEASLDDIARISNPETAAMIGLMRLGRLEIIPGGGGRYGKVKKHNRHE